MPKSRTTRSDLSWSVHNTCIISFQEEHGSPMSNHAPALPRCMLLMQLDSSTTYSNHHQRSPNSRTKDVSPFPHISCLNRLGSSDSQTAISSHFYLLGTRKDWTYQRMRISVSRYHLLLSSVKITELSPASGPLGMSAGRCACICVMRRVSESGHTFAPESSHREPQISFTPPQLIRYFLT